MSDFDIVQHTILLTVGGSRIYGLNRLDSDVDVKGVVIPPARYFHGILHRFEHSEAVEGFIPYLNADEREAAQHTKLEGTLFEIRKFLSLASECNPNILDSLFCRDSEVRHITPLGEVLRNARGLFLSAESRHTFSGYASSQLKRIRGHRQWLLHPPKQPPLRADFDLPETTLLPKDQLAAAEAAVRKQIERWDVDWASLSPAAAIHIKSAIAEHLGEIRVALGFETDGRATWLAAARRVGLDSNLIYIMQREREYEAAARHWRQFVQWKTERNPARAALEAKHGYDTKHASHLVRLLRMGREILATGKVNVWRGADGGTGDAEELRTIRDGAWSYDQLVETAEGEERELQRIYQERTYVVPAKPDRASIEQLCLTLVETGLAQTGAPASKALNYPETGLDHL